MSEIKELIKKEQPHSIKFGINAKNQWSGECKIYGDNPQDVLDKAKEIANKLETIIKDKNGI